jgi:flagellar hook-basal body complex protein FliE
MAIDAVQMGLSSLMGLGGNPEAYTKVAGGFGLGKASFEDYLREALKITDEANTKAVADKGNFRDYLIDALRSGNEADKKVSGGFGGNKANFQDYLVGALSYVNETQQNSAAITERLITDPDSVDVHDVTTAMAEAKMTLDIAQNVISRMITAWNEITTTR